MRHLFLALLTILLGAAFTPSMALAGDDKKPSPFTPRGADDDGEPTPEEIKRNADKELAKQQQKEKENEKKTPTQQPQPQNVPPPQPKLPPAAPFDKAASKAAWEQKTGIKFESVGNQYVIAYGQYGPAEMKQIGDALDKAVALIKTTNGPAMLPPEGTPPYELFFCNNEASYFKILEAQGHKLEDWQRKLSGIFTPAYAVNKPPIPNTHNPNKAVFQFGRNLAVLGSASKAQTWIVEGYASYLERETIGHNENYTISYQDNSVKFGGHWNAECKKLMVEKKLRPWTEMYSVEPIGLTAGHYLTLFSMVSYLNKMDPKAFPKMLQMIADGTHGSIAVEKAYNRKTPALEGAWAQWVMTLK